jgi:hypothetical protein
MPMTRVMTGQGSDPTSGVQELLTRGQEGRRRTASPIGGATVVDLLAVPDEAVREDPGDRRPVVVRPDEVEVVLDPSWLLDLHDPSLVISHSYVGPDRRLVGRTEDAPGPISARWFRLLRRVIQVAVLTAAVVVPLVLIASPAVPPAARSTPPAATKATPATTAARGHRAPRTLRASGTRPARVVRAGAAHQRALARARAAAVAAAPAATAASPRATASARSASRVRNHARTVQVRAAARAAAARHRADRAAARSRRGGRATGPSV